MDCNNVNLTIGSTGAQVKELQKYMTKFGYYDGIIDGYYQSYTQKAVIKMQNDCGVKADGIFGSITCKASGINGKCIDTRIGSILLDDWKNIMQRYNTYLKEHKTEPQICYLDINDKYRYISNAKYKDILQRYNDYKLKNNKEPSQVYINKIKINISGVLEKATDAVGEFIINGNPWQSFINFYNKIRGRKYLHYNNDIYPQSTAFQRLKNRNGLNCSDISQLLYAVAKALGLDARFVHIVCRSKIGHIQLDVRNPYTKRYIRIDGAAALSVNSQYSFGRLWCANGYLQSYQDAWLVSDDGKT